MWEALIRNGSHDVRNCFAAFIHLYSAIQAAISLEIYIENH